MKDQVKDTFNQLADVYENKIDTNGLYNSEYERPAMMRQIPSDLTGMNVLDAGCAAGWYSLQLVNRGANVVATDMSPEMVKSAERRVGNRAKVLCLDLENNLPFEDHTFDFILSSLTLHYIKDWDQTFREFQRILKKDSPFLFSIHHPITDINRLSEPNYFSTELIIDRWKKEGKVYKVPFFRRPLQEIVNTTLKYFIIEEVIEPEPTLTFKQESPDSYKRLMNSPQFLIIRARSR